MRSTVCLSALAGLLQLAACSRSSGTPAQESPPPAPPPPAAPEVNAARLTAADSDQNNWLTHGRTYDEQRFSPLSQIRRAT